MGKTSLRIKADKAKQFRCKGLVIVLENPKTIANVGTVIRNIDALGAGKLYVIDGYNLLPEKWQDMRERAKLNDISASAIKWTYVRRFKTTDDCINYLIKKDFESYSTSPHQLGKANVEVHNAVYTVPRLAIWFGNEAKGLSKTALDYCVVNITIPMCGIIESLNLGTTTGIVIYQAATQRREFSRKLDFNKLSYARV